MRPVLAGILVAFTVAAQENGPEPEAISLGFDGVLQGVRELLDSVDALGPIDQGLAEEGEPLVLTARDAVQRALDNAPRIIGAEADAAAQKALQGQARSQYLPQVSVQSGYSYLEDPSQGFGGGVLTRLIVPGGVEVDDIQRADSLKVQQLVFVGGSVRAAVRAAGYLAQSKEWQRNATRNDVEFETKRAYYDCLLSLALVQVAEDSVTTFERHRRDSQLKLDAGLASRFEVLRAETELGSREADVVEARNRVRLAYAALRRLLAVDQKQPLALTDTVPWLPLEASADQLASNAVESRPEIRALRAVADASHNDVKRVKGSYFPKVAASAEWTQIEGGGSFSLEGWQLRLGAELEIFTGGRRKFEKKEAEARVRSAESQIEEVKLLIELEVRQALIQVQDAIAKIRREEGNVELADEGQRLAELRFQEGVGTQADVLDAELALTNAETQLVLALRDYAVAHAALDKSTGKSWFPFEEQTADSQE